MRDLNMYASICMKELDSIDIKYGSIKKFVVNTRATRRWGNCSGNKVNGFTIQISAVLLDECNDEIGLKNTIIHELLHSCDGCMNHGASWKRLAEKVNSKLGYNIKRCSSASEKGVVEDHRLDNRRQYVIVCEKCGLTYTRQRACRLVENPELFRCGRCGGKLKKIDLK